MREADPFGSGVSGAAASCGSDEGGGLAEVKAGREVYSRGPLSLRAVKHVPVLLFELQDDTRLAKIEPHRLGLRVVVVHGPEVLPAALEVG